MYVSSTTKSIAKSDQNTRHGFNWFDRRGTEGVGFIRALRTLLTNNLPQILPDLSCIIRTRFEQLHAGHSMVKGKQLTCILANAILRGNTFEQARYIRRYIT